MDFGASILLLLSIVTHGRVTSMSHSARLPSTKKTLDTSKRCNTNKRCNTCNMLKQCLKLACIVNNCLLVLLDGMIIWS